MSQKRIIISTHSGTQSVRTYAVNWCISEYVIVSFALPFKYVGYNKRVAEQTGPIGRELIVSLSGIPGLTDGFLKPNLLQLERTEAATWSDVEHGIIAALIETLPADEQSSVVVAYSAGRVPSDQDSLNIIGELQSVRDHLVR